MRDMAAAFNFIVIMSEVKLVGSEGPLRRHAPEQYNIPQLKMWPSLYSYRFPADMMVEQCFPMESRKTEMYAMGWIPMMVANEECRVWFNDGSSAILPPLPPQPSQPQKSSDVISTVDLLRLVTQGRARLINTPATQIIKPIPSPVRSGPCQMETCTGRCGLPLHTRSNVMLAKAVRTGHILWGDLE
jgi:hypothetical protein